MDTRLSDDQKALEEHCARLLANEWTTRHALETLGPDGNGHSAELWATFADNGWLGLSVAEDLGGTGASLIDLGLLHRSAGYRLVPSTFYSTVFASLLVEKIAQTSHARELLAPIIAGKSVATVAFSEPAASDDHRCWRAAASWNGQGWRLEGTKAFVANAQIADTILVLAQVRSGMDRQGWGLFKLDRSAIPKISGQNSFGSERLCTVTLDGLLLPADALIGGTEALGNTLGTFLDVRETAATLQCMEMAGGIQSVLDQTVAYVGERQVLGRAVGSNQAVQHMLANIWIYLNGARVAALHALYLKDKGDPATREVAIAKIALGKCYTEVTIAAHQLWGSMGYATETGLYLWSERAKLTDAWMGSRHSHRGRLITEMGL